MKKIQSEVMGRAWEIKKEENIAFAVALKKSWAEMKKYLEKNAKYIRSLKSAIEKMSVYVLERFSSNKKIYENGIHVIETNLEELEDFFENSYIKETKKKLYDVFNHIAKKENGYSLRMIEELVVEVENKSEVYNFISEYECHIWHIENNEFLTKEAQEIKDRIKSAVKSRKIKFMRGGVKLDVTEKTLDFIEKI